MVTELCRITGHAYALFNQSLKITERIGDVQGKANIPTHFFPWLRKKLRDLPPKILEFNYQLKHNVSSPPFS
ncbi:MAG: hypothetical protein RM368_30805 [Nostoc sp. DedSLP03]|uniref:hypothetical protein n=1 Tax=Nostoc sp. DedSLP03 TaxID=3075400 RepID=UPI002AD4CAB5|nr:hypothetical protein [Nostoc sp. DedSLP03]MDZ7969286.1 hypothetical protein [Nostoc sp. DedSLP03]